MTRQAQDHLTTRAGAFNFPCRGGVPGSWSLAQASGLGVACGASQSMVPGESDI